jgi:hypothetical protein
MNIDINTMELDTTNNYKNIEIRLKTSQYTLRLKDVPSLSQSKLRIKLT